MAPIGRLAVGSVDEVMVGMEMIPHCETEQKRQGHLGEQASRLKQAWLGHRVTLIANAVWHVHWIS